MFRFAPIYAGFFGLLSFLNPNAWRDGAGEWAPEAIDLAADAFEDLPELEPSDDPESFRVEGKSPR